MVSDERGAATKQFTKKTSERASGWEDKRLAGYRK